MPGPASVVGFEAVPIDLELPDLISWLPPVRIPGKNSSPKNSGAANHNDQLRFVYSASSESEMPVLKRSW